jgi:hypothetical protein
MATVIALWLISGVTVGQVGTFVGYQAVFVVGPGWLLYRALVRRDDDGFRRLVFGWALGYVLELMAFVVTAALSARSLMIFYPVVVAAATVPVLRRRGGAYAGPKLVRPAAWAWAVAAICVLSLAYVGLEYFGASPLPERVHAVSYGKDAVWALSLAAEARHHWPVQDPTVVGQSLPYHWFASFDVAAINQVTGLSLPLVFFRLYLVPMILLVVLGLCVAGEAVSRRPWVGPIAASLVLFVTELSLDPHSGYSFANELSDDIVSISPSFLFGLVFFVPALILLYELCDDRNPRRGRDAGVWIALTLLLVGCAGAKATILPVLIGGLALYVSWRLGTERRIDRVLAAALGAALALYALAWVVEYRIAGNGDLRFRIPGAVRQMAAIGHARAQLAGSHSLEPLFWALATPVGLAGAYGAALCGLIWAFGARDRAAPRGHGLLLTLLAASLAPYLAFKHFGLSQVFFSQYGVTAGCLLAGEGLYMLWRRDRSRRLMRRQLSIGVAWLGLLLGIAFGVTALVGGSRTKRWIYLDLDLALATGLLLVCALGIRSRFKPNGRWLYLMMAAVLAGALAKPLQVVSPAVARLADGKPLHSNTGRALTSGLLAGLVWIRTHTPTSAVIAVNNYGEASTGSKVPTNYYYSAFAERRVFLEGWIYAQRSSDLGQAQVALGRKKPFPGRELLDYATFQRADRAALRTLTQQYGVRYLVVDRVHNDHFSPRLPRLACSVFANRDVAIYRVSFTQEVRYAPASGAASRARGRLAPHPCPVRAAGRGRRGSAVPDSRGRTAA